MGLDIPKWAFLINNISSLAGNCRYIDMAVFCKQPCVHSWQACGSSSFNQQISKDENLSLNMFLMEVSIFMADLEINKTSVTNNCGRWHKDCLSSLFPASPSMRRDLDCLMNWPPADTVQHNKKFSWDHAGGVLGDTSAITSPWERCWSGRAMQSGFSPSCGGTKEGVSRKQWITGKHLLAQPRQEEPPLRHPCSENDTEKLNGKEKEANLSEKLRRNLLWAIDWQMTCRQRANTLIDRKIPKKSLCCSRAKYNKNLVWKQKTGNTKINHDFKKATDYSLEETIDELEDSLMAIKWPCGWHILVKYKSLDWLQVCQCKCCFPCVWPSLCPML